MAEKETEAREATLHYADGRVRKTPFMPAEFHTRYLEFLGTHFERQKDGSYAETGRPVSTGEAAKSPGKKSGSSSKLTNGGKK